MSKAAYAVNHCGLVSEFRYQNQGLKEDEGFDFSEMVMNRAAEIARDVAERRQGQGVSLPHGLGAVEVTAQGVAHFVIENGARQICRDLGTDFEVLAHHATARHISSC